MTDPAGEGVALFVPEGDHFLPTQFTEGPWDPDAQFGGAPSSLFATLVEAVPTLVPMQVARFTVDLLRPVPLSPLHPTVRVVREGKRIQVVQASLWAGTLEVARCAALRVRTVDLGDLDLPTGEAPNPLPDSPRGTWSEIFPGRKPPGSRLAVEYLFEDTGGYFSDPTWVRLRVRVIAGRPTSPMARLAYLADLASGIGDPRDAPIRSINADLSLNVTRYPTGEWISITGTGRISRAGIGQTNATLSDTSGPVATVSLARLVDLLPAAALAGHGGEDRPEPAKPG
ncbi:MAG TPA: thioesterase family protein [Acidimicrobiales bacterium]|nr:thioesterase family protein [Acidimicrobiales bacterium]